MTIKTPVWLFSMDSDQFHAAPLTTGGLQAYYQCYGAQQHQAAFELVHYRDDDALAQWITREKAQLISAAEQALEQGLQPVIGFSFYTWNAAQFLDLVEQLKVACPALLCIAGGPHVQEAETYLLADPIDVVVLGEGEQTFTELLDAVLDAGADQSQQAPVNLGFSAIDGLAWTENGNLDRSKERPREKDLSRLPSAFDVVPLQDANGKALYDSISYETSRGCPFKCAFCEWGTGAIGGKMYQHSMERIQADWQKVIDAGIENIWLADSNFGALRDDLEKTKLICEFKETTGLPRTFATSWSKKHSPRVQEIVLMLHDNGLLPHYQLALQTLTPLALELSHRKNMAANKYEPIAKQMAEAGVPIAAELIWGLPGDNLNDFEYNLDSLLATFPNINIFGYTLLPGTEFYERRDEYEIDTIPVAGYGKAKGEYVVACHTFNREEGLNGYFMIAAHIVLVHGHIMPLTIRYLAMLEGFPATPLLRQVLAALIDAFSGVLAGIGFDSSALDKLAIYEERAIIYLSLLNNPSKTFEVIASEIEKWCVVNGAAKTVLLPALKVLTLDSAICPRVGPAGEETFTFDFDAVSVLSALENMELPSLEIFEQTAGPKEQSLLLRHPGGAGEVLKDPDGGSWIRGQWFEVKGSDKLIAVSVDSGNESPLLQSIAQNR